MRGDADAQRVSWRECAASFQHHQHVLSLESAQYVLGIRSAIVRHPESNRLGRLRRRVESFSTSIVNTIMRHVASGESR